MNLEESQNQRGRGNSTPAAGFLYVNSNFHMIVGVCILGCNLQVVRQGGMNMKKAGLRFLGIPCIAGGLSKKFLTFLLTFWYTFSSTYPDSPGVDAA